MTSKVTLPVLTLSSRGLSKLEVSDTHGGVFVSGNPLTQSQQKFCSCILGATSANNPYAVCAKSTGTTSRLCSEYYDFYTMPLAKLEGYYLLHKIPMPISRDRDSLIEGIRQWKLSTGHSLSSNLLSQPSSENSCGCGSPSKSSINTIVPIGSNKGIISPRLPPSPLGQTNTVIPIGYSRPTSPSRVSVKPIKSVAIIPVGTGRSTSPTRASFKPAAVTSNGSKRITSPSRTIVSTRTTAPIIPMQFGPITSPIRSSNMK